VDGQLLYLPGKYSDPFTMPAIADTRRFGAGVAYSNVSHLWDSHNKTSRQADEAVQLLSKPLHPTWYQGPPILAKVHLGLVEL
jgi:hypothetical protein